MTTIYVITHHQFNHGEGRLPLDPRFLESNKNYVYYLIDAQIPSSLQGKQVILEKQFDPIIAKAGAQQFAEWAFLLAEEKYAFCSYPFYMISSRFYQKNHWLWRDLNAEWDQLFQLLKTYSWGFLPSYDRPLKWIDTSWKHRLSERYQRTHFFPFTEKTFSLIEDIYGVRCPQDYSHMADFYCNYIGFQSRSDLLAYVRFYQPLIDRLFHADLTPKEDLFQYVHRPTTGRSIKPFTFLIEYFSHLFFFKQQLPYVALHYDGHYEIDEAKKKMKRIVSFPVPLSKKIDRIVSSKWKELKYGSVIRPAVLWMREQKKALFSEG